jgi:DNA-binding NtrC family response regulator
LEAFLGEKYHILKASNGQDGIKQFEKNMRRIHLILTDLVLPDYIGESLISLFKRLAPEKPVVAMTGWDYNYENA